MLWLCVYIALNARWSLVLTSSTRTSWSSSFCLLVFVLAGHVFEFVLFTYDVAAVKCSLQGSSPLPNREFTHMHTHPDIRFINVLIDLIHSLETS